MALTALVSGCAVTPPAGQPVTPTAGTSVPSGNPAQAASAAPADTAAKPAATIRQDLPAARAVVTERDLGIKLTSLRMASTGTTVELRFYLDDPRKGAKLFDRETPPFLMDESGGPALTTAAPPIAYGTGRSAAPDRAPRRRSYLLQFSNARQSVRAGSRVSLVVGDLKVTGLVVE
ncbi:MAG: hypothetical protein WBP72_05185 [Rhodocyclaceae bacterium]